jgi:hypothetical protein
MNRNVSSVSAVDEELSHAQSQSNLERLRETIDREGTPSNGVPTPLLRELEKLTLALEAHAAGTWAAINQEVATEPERMELLIYSEYLTADALNRIGFALWPDPTLDPARQQEAQHRVDRIIQQWRVDTA